MKKTRPRHIRIKPNSAKLLVKKNLKSNQIKKKKKDKLLREAKKRMTADFSWETRQMRRQENNIPKIFKGKKHYKMYKNHC